MIENLSLDNYKINAVWQRVNRESQTRDQQKCIGAARMTSTDPISDLKRFMDDASESACYCRKIAGRVGGRINRTLTCIAEIERRHLRKLRAEYFLMTGSTYCPEPTNVCICSVSEALRKIYSSRVTASEEYARAAERASRGLSCVYRQYSCEEEKNADSIICLIEAMMC